MLSELLVQLQTGPVAADALAQRIAAASAVLLAPASRDRLQLVRHQCCAWSIPLRADGLKRPLKDLCDDLDAALRAEATKLLDDFASATGAGLADSASSSASRPKRARLSEQTDLVQHSTQLSSQVDHVVAADARRGIVRPLELEPAEAAVSVMSLERAGEHLFRATVADDRVLLLDREALQTMPQG